MAFKFLTQESWLTNRNDRGEGIPNPVVCDSLLDPRYGGARHNVELKICLAIWFDQHTPAMGQMQDANKDWYNVDPWGTDFFDWCMTACDQATKAFDNKLMLIPPARYNGLDRKEPDGTIWRPNIVCRFLCQFGSANYFHAKVKVGNTKPLTHADGSVTDFRAWSRAWAKIHLAGGTYGSAVGNITQKTLAHETGHLLGLHHIGGVAEVAQCIMLTESPVVGATGSNVNYGGADPDPSFPNNIMGLGMQVSQFNALPWQQEFCRHVNYYEHGHEKLQPHELIATAEKHYPTQVTW
jgi:hypothetical protein